MEIVEKELGKVRLVYNKSINFYSITDGKNVSRIPKGSKHLHFDTEQLAEAKVVDLGITLIDKEALLNP